MEATYTCRKWGDCVVRVLMEKTIGGSPPMYGRVIIFRSKAFVHLVLNGKRLTKISIRNRQIWLRRYVPRPIATQNQNSYVASIHGSRTYDMHQAS
uniref:Uncharacterized protein n=1 Tax=Leersia perrieri TaxID=77586 RepID=A0A0D9XIA4_9ORYZ